MLIKYWSVTDKQMHTLGQTDVNVKIIIWIELCFNKLVPSVSNKHWAMFINLKDFITSLCLYLGHFFFFKKFWWLRLLIFKKIHGYIYLELYRVRHIYWNDFDSSPFLSQLTHEIVIYLFRMPWIVTFECRYKTGNKSVMRGSRRVLVKLVEFDFGTKI